MLKVITIFTQAEYDAVPNIGSTVSFLRSSVVLVSIGHGSFTILKDRYTELEGAADTQDLKAWIAQDSDDRRIDE